MLDNYVYWQIIIIVGGGHNFDTWGPLPSFPLLSPSSVKIFREKRRCKHFGKRKNLDKMCTYDFKKNTEYLKSFCLLFTPAKYIIVIKSVLSDRKLVLKLKIELI